MEVTVIEANILLDALNRLSSAIENGDQPWEDYTCDLLEGEANRIVYVGTVLRLYSKLTTFLSEAEWTGIESTS